MGTLRSTSSATTVPLAAETVVGRSRSCQLVLTRPSVSSLQACIRWRDRSWWIHDLGSRNATFVDGGKLAAEGWRRLHAGARVAFGDESELWELSDAGPPGPSALPLGGGPPRIANSEGVIVLGRSSQQERIKVGANGTALLEVPGIEALTLSSQQEFEAAGATWIYCFGAADTRELRRPLAVSDTLLRLSVSQHQEQIEVEFEAGRRKVQLQGREHHFSVLELVRQRLHDGATDLMESSKGWIHREDLLSRLRITRELLNLHLHRFRRELEESGFTDPGEAIQRRRQAGELRIGFRQLELRE